MKGATRVGLALYRFLVRALLPGAFRQEYGEELVQAVAVRLAAAHGGLASWTALAAEVADLVRTAVREWRETAAGRVAERRNEHGTRESVMEDAWAELKVTLRALARRPGLALGVTLTIGLGVGATTAIYGVVDGVVLRPLPYEDPSGLVTIGTLGDAAPPDAATDLQALTDINSVVYKRYRERARAFAELAALEPYRVTLSNADGAEEQIPGVRVSQELFDMLGVSPVLGRAFLPEEYALFADGVAMISYEYWQNQYGGDPDVLGRAIATLPSSGPEYIVVGVLPRAFRLPETLFAPGGLPQVYAPLPLADPPPGVVLLFPVQGLGRLAPGATLEQARAEAERLHGEISVEIAELPRMPLLQSRGIGVNDLHAQTVGATARSLWVFLGAAALLLLLTSMNAASLLLARALDRTRELGVRVSLGAGRGRVVRLLLAEAGTLSLIGGAIGVALAYGGVAAFLRLAPPSIPRLDSVAVDGRVLFAATLMTLATAVGAGLLPALRLTAGRPWKALQRGGRTASDTSTGARTVLVGGQLALDRCGRARPRARRRGPRPRTRRPRSGARHRSDGSRSAAQARSA
jgi:predicted permease